MTLFDPDLLSTPRAAVPRAGAAPAPVPTPAPAACAVPPVEVIRSKKRKRTVGAQVRDGVLRVTVPSWMSKADEAQWVTRMAARFARMASTERVDLAERASVLARRHGLRRPSEIKWADNMASRWGSCTPSTGVIRISTRLAPFPDWVIDYVIVHELVHLEIPGHGADFWERAARYPRMERAIGYLMAKAADTDHPEQGHPATL